MTFSDVQIDLCVDKASIHINLIFKPFIVCMHVQEVCSTVCM